MKARLSKSIATVLCLCIVTVVGCGGTSASTSHAEVKKVEVAEQEFSRAYRRANVDSRSLCERKTTSDSAFKRCFGAGVKPREQAAEEDFARDIDKVLAAGVGSECEEALKAVVAESSQVPLFEGEATEACRAESRSD